MDIVEAINKRKSIRAFKPDPIPQKILKEIVELALRAPSWGNTQPWELAVVTGPKLEEIKRAFVTRVDESHQPDVTAPLQFPDPYGSRRRTLGIKIFEIEGIKREDKEKRREWQQRGLRLFDAPCAIYIYTDRSFYSQSNGVNVWSVFDCGLVLENIMLLAAAYGLGTIPEIQSVAFPDILKKVLGISDSKLIVLGMAIGYPDWDHPLNKFRSEREPMDKVARWYGFSEK